MMPSASVPLERYEQLASRMGRLEAQLEATRRSLSERDQREAELRSRSERLALARQSAEVELRRQRAARERAEQRLRASRTAAASTPAPDGGGILWLFAALAPLWLIPLEGYAGSPSPLTLILADLGVSSTLGMIGMQMGARVGALGLAVLLRNASVGGFLLLADVALCLPLI